MARTKLSESKSKDKTASVAAVAAVTATEGRKSKPKVNRARKALREMHRLNHDVKNIFAKAVFRRRTSTFIPKARFAPQAIAKIQGVVENIVLRRVREAVKICSFQGRWTLQEKHFDMRRELYSQV